MENDITSISFLCSYLLTAIFLSSGKVSTLSHGTPLSGCRYSAITKLNYGISDGEELSYTCDIIYNQKMGRRFAETFSVPKTIPSSTFPTPILSESRPLNNSVMIGISVDIVLVVVALGMVYLYLKHKKDSNLSTTKSEEQKRLNQTPDGQ